MYTTPASNVDNIASVSEENSAAAEEVSASTEEMSAQVEEISASAQSLSELAATLFQAVSHFQLKASQGTSKQEKSQQPGESLKTLITDILRKPLA